ncbi:TPA: LPD7 domain-containing protein [Neisseria meningitidis]|nr:PriCT-2 domain-containing protein [Neisseria meningitidis]
MDDYEKARDALNYIDPNLPRSDWVKIGTALKNHFGEDGKQLFQEFSERGEGYKKQSFEHTWKSLDPTRSSIGTLFYQAKQYGYQQPRNDRPITSVETETAKAEREAKRAEEARFAAEERAKKVEQARKYVSISKDADFTHPYLQKKGIDTPEGIAGLKHYKTQNNHLLYIPIQDKDGNIQGVQRIFPDGNKGIVGNKVGGFFVMGDLSEAREKGVILAEGYATAYALHKNSDHTPVIVGFDAHNIINVAKILKDKLPEDTKLIVAADNDIHLEKAGKTNEGIAGAKQAVAAFGQNATMIYPTFPPEVISGKMSDFDDYQRHVNAEGIKQAISQAKAKLGLSTEMSKEQGINPMENQPENTSAASEQQIPTEAPSPLPVDEKPPISLERTKEEEAVPDLPPPMSDAEIMASMGQSPDYEQDYFQPDTYNSIELGKAEEQAVEQQKVAEPTIQLSAVENGQQKEAESAAQDYRRDAIEQAIHDTDIQEQIQHGEAPDSMKDKADKAFAIANDTELQRSQADYEESMRRQNAEQAQTATPPESKPQNQPQLEFRIPDSVAAQYRTNGNEKYMLDPRTDKLAIDARSENILKTRNNDKKTIKNMLAIAETNGWQNIKVKGSPEFKKEIWLQASLKGLEVQGYKPSEQDKKLLETRKAQLERGINSISKENNPSQQVRQTSGKLMGYGVGVHPNNKEGKNTYYVDIQKSNGQTERLYGHGLRDAIIQSKAERGDNITLTKTGHNGKNNTWQADVSKQKTASQKLIDAARTSGSPEALKMAQQAFARDHLAKRAEQTIKADREARRNVEQEVKLPQKQKEKSADIEMTR